MATHEPLVPTGLPYGGRQQYEQAAQVAGLPSSVPVAAASPSSPTPAAATAAGPSLSQFDVLANREPSGVIPDAAAPTGPSGFRMRVAASPNAAMRYYFSQVDGYLEG